jgi:hypothetical protein
MSKARHAPRMAAQAEMLSYGAVRKGMRLAHHSPGPSGTVVRELTS